MKILFSFNYIWDEDPVWIDTLHIPRLGESVYYKDVEYTVIKIVYNTHQFGQDITGHKGVMGTPYIDLEIVHKTLKEKLSVSWRKLLKWLV